MISAAIIDDEKNARIVLHAMIERHFGDKIKIVTSAESLKDGVASIYEYHPDIVFIDIEMPGENGLKIYDYFREINFQIIFVTAHQQYAIEALRHHAFDYLLKPVRQDELRRVFDRFDKIEKTKIDAEHVKRLLDSLSPYPETRGKVVFPTFTGYHFENTNSIMYCEADGNYSKIFTFYGQQVLISKPIGYLVNLLPTDIFLRIHKSFLVNMNYVKLYTHAEGYQIVLDNGKILDVASRRHMEVLEKLKNRSS